MNKAKKFILFTTISFAIIFFIIYKLLGTVDDGKPKAIEYPQSNLSDDVFVSQNTEYVTNSTFPVSYSMPDIPFMVDLVDGKTADIGTGHLVYGSDAVTLYVSQFPKDENAHEVVLKQYSSAVHLNFDMNASYVQTATSDIGYVNGYYATYFIDHLLISTGRSVTTQSAYVIGYVIDPGEEYDYNMILSLATTDETSESLKLCKEYLDAITLTLRYDEQLDKEQTRARENALEEEMRRLKKLEQEAEREKEKESQTGAVSSTASAEDVPILVTRDYNNMSILVTWTNSCEDVEMTLESGTGNKRIIVAYPETIGSKQALFEVGPCAKGEYYLSCSHTKYCGEMNVKLLEN